MNPNRRVLIVDDDRDICLMLSRLMKGEGLASEIAHDGQTALKLVRSQRPDALLLDLKMPGMDGMEVLRRVKEMDTDLPVVLITAHADIAGSVAAIKAGAFDYLPKPFEHPQVAQVVRRALALRAEGLAPAGAPGHDSQDAGLREMMGPSDAVSRVICEINQVAASDFSVVIQGETGAGKELVARAIHLLSRRAAKDFVPVDCGAIPETLLESELFGYQKGAFTGAVLAKAGKFAAAQGGTLFLDEISNLPLGSQAKLLRALQDRVIYQLGATRPTAVDVRVLVATNQDLKTMVESNLMRRDLFFRLNEFTIAIPPLRERKEDIPYLAKRFLDITNRELGKNVKSFTASCLEAMFDYSWPGNVRQLRSVIRRAVLLADEVVTENHLDLKRAPVPGLAFTPKVQGTPWRDLSLKEIVRQSILTVEKEVLAQALKHTGGNKAKAARLLQIDYKTMHTKVKLFGIKRPGGQYD
jgi:DNA-binding NtrC family response regulator